MLKFIYPQIKRSDLRHIIKYALLGAIIAGIYGTLHDQITYTISPEYFTKLKFKQFDFANWGIGDRFFVGTIGFLATWWVGLFIGWFLGRRYVPNQTAQQAANNVLKGFVIVFLSGIAFAVSAGIYGLWIDPEDIPSNWHHALKYYGVSDGYAFVRVAYIHNFGYAGGLIGLISVFIFLKPNVKVCN